jgi:hypothetical protein
MASEILQLGIGLKIGLLSEKAFKKWSSGVGTAAYTLGYTFWTHVVWIIGWGYEIWNCFWTMGAELLGSDGQVCNRALVVIAGTQDVGRTGVEPMAMVAESEADGIWMILDSGANTCLLRGEEGKYLNGAMPSGQKIGIASGVHLRAGVKGGLGFHIGAIPVQIPGVFSGPDVNYNLIGTNLLGEQGFTTVIHQNRVLLMDSKVFNVNEKEIIHEGKIDPKTQLPMIKLEFGKMTRWRRKAQEEIKERRLVDYTPI